MEFSFSLIRHRLTEARGRPAPEAWPDRPEGRLVWVHLLGASGGTALVLDDLLDRHPDIALLASGAAEELTVPAIRCDAPPDTPGAARRFLDHFRPDLVVYSGARPLPVIWSEAAARGIPQALFDGDPFLHPLPLVRPLNRFAFTAFRRPDPRLQRGGDVIGALCDVPPPPAVARGEVEAMAAAIASRPVWMATAVPETEIDDVMEAHALAAQLSHRLLLILEPADLDDGAALHARIVARGWAAIRRVDGEEPSRETRVVIADAPEETGLWLRLASISYLGGTLRGASATCPPMVPAALGSVVIHGPELGEAAEAISRLQSGKAAWRVASGEELGRAVEQFQAPDRAAEMAQAGWAVTTHGADISAAALDALDALLTAMDGP